MYMRFNGGRIGHNIQYRTYSDIGEETEDMDFVDLSGTGDTVELDNAAGGRSESEVGSESEVESIEGSSESSENSEVEPPVSDVSNDGYGSA